MLDVEAAPPAAPSPAAFAMTGCQLAKGMSQAYHEGSQVWLPHVEVVNSLAADGSKRKHTSWRRGAVQVRPLRLSDACITSISVDPNRQPLSAAPLSLGSPPSSRLPPRPPRPGPLLPFLQTIAQRDGDLALTVRTEDGAMLDALASECCLQNERDDTVDDLVRSDFLHEPG